MASRKGNIMKKDRRSAIYEATGNMSAVTKDMIKIARMLEESKCNKEANLIRTQAANFENLMYKIINDN